MKYLGCLLLFFLPLAGIAQTSITDLETYPVFNDCTQVEFAREGDCFKNTLRKHILETFELPTRVIEENYTGEAFVLFEVDREGKFQVLYVDAIYAELKEELVRVFQTLPVVEPPTYNGRPTYAQFRMPLRIPLNFTNVPPVQEIEEQVTAIEDPTAAPLVQPQDEYDQIVSRPFRNRESQSNLNIPLSHERYSRFDAAMNRIGTNSHTASKPFLYKDVSSYYDFKQEREELEKSTSSWLGRKLWNEHLVTFQGENYWFTGDVILDLQLGRDFQSDYDFTYNNTRGAVFQGGLGKDLHFYTVVFESQGRFADYFNRYAESIAPFMGSGVAIIPGRGIAKEFMDGGYDYPVAEGYISYSPSEFFDIQLGHGNNFIGDGYRSLLMSDNPNPHPYLKLNTSFWKLKYTNTWMSLRDVREEVAGEGAYRTKYMANHYLSLNLTKRLNIGLFESVVWQDDNGRGFDVNYLNPVIFYRAIEFSTGARGGNALIGLTGKYKLSDQFNAYGQWIIDEFSSSDVFGGEGSWKNKLGFQLGLKYFNAFNIPDLYLQAEYNQVRPYTYSHNSVVLNYGHNNQSMAHLWGANFREFVAIARYRKERIYGSAKLVLGERGFDFNNEKDNFYYGGDIYRSERERALETGVRIGQGNTATSFFTEVEAGYIINPVTNLKLFGSVIYRNFDPLENTAATFNNNTVWLNVGVRTDIFNWYFDY
ncbi:gliding motility protein RemB [Antarcticibacterium flavum]|uniref:Gliding motility protein RemB n=1 Tax=Antarcticibacterium flavum TaxID=2058175 RepID=A0A5B7X5X8_9FLAO|nr:MULTISPECIES: gliding motility protein RemB [Antarcticibacterium]MCM4158361.1 gliding motility protein RemB [Antarcticibacterium sp. W02-3]QCY70122.1 gliding motility protein RemB [Antarcticibacterium flavum]